jgi:hypothetical protein
MLTTRQLHELTQAQHFLGLSLKIKQNLEKIESQRTD